MTGKILYIHGFASSGSTGTAAQLRAHFYPQGVAVVSPDVPVSPLEAMRSLRALAERERPTLVVATSMGALYAEQLRGVRRVLVNPSFHMARLLTFRGLGRREFRNKREDGQREFRVDKAMIEEFRQVERDSFRGIDAEDRALVWGLFGTGDTLVNCRDDFRRHYGEGRLRLFEGGHFLNDKALHAALLPLIRETGTGEDTAQNTRYV